jgi:hypothetical protein
MFFKYADYQHAANEVDVTTIQQQRMFSPRNRYVFIRKTMTVMGHFCTSGQDAIRLALQNLEKTYLTIHGGDAGLYHDDGTPSAHFLPEAGSLNGIRILTLDYPKEEGGEYVTGRSYRIVLQADYMPQLFDNTYSWEQTISMQGTGGPSWEYIPQFVGPPTYQINAMVTVQRFIQTGQSVGVADYTPLPLILWPNDEHGELRMIEYGVPQKPGIYIPLLFPMQWRFVYSFPGPKAVWGVKPITPA